MSLRVTATEVSPEEGEAPVTEILQEATAWGATPAAPPSPPGPCEAPTAVGIAPAGAGAAAPP